MKADDKRAARAAYKERDVSAGIYAVRCAATGQRWIGRAMDLSTIENRVWFGLRQGNHPRRSLQAAWRAHGADRFAFEIVERLDEDRLGSFPQDVLRDRLAHWLERLGAEPV